MNTPAPIAIIRAHLEAITDNQLDIAEWVNSEEFDHMQFSTLESLRDLLDIIRKWEKTEQVRELHICN